MLLCLDDEINIVATAENGYDAFELAGKLAPELILMDLKMPVMNGVDPTRKILHDYPEIKSWH